MSGVKGTDLREAVIEAGEQAGTIWALKHSGDLNVNLVRFPVGWGVGEHVKTRWKLCSWGCRVRVWSRLTGTSTSCRRGPWCSCRRVPGVRP